MEFKDIKVGNYYRMIWKPGAEELDEKYFIDVIFICESKGLEDFTIKVLMSNTGDYFKESWALGATQIFIKNSVGLAYVTELNKEDVN